MLWLVPVVLAAAPGAPAVTLVVEGPTAADTKRELSAATLPVEVRVTDVPTASAPEPTPSPWNEKLASARKSYVSANFSDCLRALEGDDATLTLLSAGERVLAARLLMWRAACHTGAKQPEPARAAAEALATLQLHLPDDVGSTTPDVEALLAQTFTLVGARPLVALAIESTPSGATVALDGRPAACTTPCRMEVFPGSHTVQVSADGYTPGARLVTGPLERFTLAPAEPQLAATQWRARTAKGETIDSEASMKLLSNSLRAPRLVVMASSPATPTTLRGALAVDGVLKARAERSGDAEGLLRDLLVRGQVVEEAPPLYKRWPFWLAVGGAAIAAGVTTAVVVGTRTTITKVELKP